MDTTGRLRANFLEVWQYPGLARTQIPTREARFPGGIDSLVQVEESYMKTAKNSLKGG